MSDVPSELLDEMTPAVRAFVEALLLRRKEREERIAELEAKLLARPLAATKTGRTTYDVNGRG